MVVATGDVVRSSLVVIAWYRIVILSSFAVILLVLGIGVQVLDFNSNSVSTSNGVLVSNSSSVVASSIRVVVVLVVVVVAGGTVAIGLPRSYSSIDGLSVAITLSSSVVVSKRDIVVLSVCWLVLLRLVVVPSELMVKVANSNDCVEDSSTSIFFVTFLRCFLVFGRAEAAAAVEDGGIEEASVA